MHKIFTAIWATILLVGLGTPLVSAKDELKSLTDRLLASPTIHTESGFTASVLVPPGQLYDPLWMVSQNGEVWLNDDGGEEGDKGSRIMAIGKDGALSVIVALGRSLPTTGFGIAPEGFGAFGGQLFTLAQPEVAAPGAVKNHVIQRIDTKTSAAATTVCTLPNAGKANKGISGFGADARFGPQGSAFANRFFAATIYNDTIYQAKADGSCTPFVTFDGKPWKEPAAIAFSADGQRMFVTVTKGNSLSSTKAAGAVLSVSADGVVDKKPVVEGLTRPLGIARAPESFGAYAGQLFVTDVGKMEIPVPMTQTLAADGKLYRVTTDGKLHLVASSFVNPAGVAFIDNALWVTDINGDFIAGKRELPDGFIVKIQPQ